MKKVLLVVCLFLLSISNCYALDINSKNAVLYNMNEDTLIFEKNKDANTSIASLTKIMTVLVALEENEDYNKQASISNMMISNLVGTGAATAGISIYEKLTINDLLYITFLPSAADAAQILAFNTTNSLNIFVDLMNKKATELGMTNTHFTNVTGLDESGQKSTLTDMAILLKYALKNEKFKEIFEATSYTSSNGKHKVSSSMRETANYYKVDLKGVTGGKTGYTINAGRCLASTAYDEENDISYLLITTNASTDTKYNHIKDAHDIYNYYFTNYKYHNLVDKGDLLIKIPTKYAKVLYVEFKAKEDVKAYLENTFSKEKVKLKYEGTNLILTNMEKGTKLGTVSVILDDKVMDTIDIVLEEKLDFSILRFIYENKEYITIGALILGFFVIIVVAIKKKKNRY